VTVREMIGAYQREVLAGDLTPERASEILLKLTALLGNCASEIREADMAYANRLLGELDAHEKANRARIVAETSPEYLRKREAHDAKDLVVELIRSLRQMLRTAGEEMRLSR
jgi:hypothetical protein